MLTKWKWSQNPILIFFQSCKFFGHGFTPLRRKNSFMVKSKLNRCWDAQSKGLVWFRQVWIGKGVVNRMENLGIMRYRRWCQMAMVILEIRRGMSGPNGLSNWWNRSGWGIKVIRFCRVWNRRLKVKIWVFMRKKRLCNLWRRMYWFCRVCINM